LCSSSSLVDRRDVLGWRRDERRKFTRSARKTDERRRTVDDHDHDHEDGDDEHEHEHEKEKEKE
jgi:hypothetical protein